MPLSKKVGFPRRQWLKTSAGLAIGAVGVGSVSYAFYRLIRSAALPKESTSGATPRNRKQLIHHIRPTIEKILSAISPEIRENEHLLFPDVKVLHLSEAHLYLDDKTKSALEAPLSTIKVLLNPFSPLKAATAVRIKRKFGPLDFPLKIYVILSDKAFKTPSKLFFIMLHEYFHVLQHATGFPDSSEFLFNDLGIERNSKNIWALREIFAYGWGLEYLHTGKVEEVFNAQVDKAKDNKILNKIKTTFKIEADSRMKLQEEKLLEHLKELPIHARVKIFKKTFSASVRKALWNKTNIRKLLPRDFQP